MPLPNRKEIPAAPVEEKKVPVIETSAVYENASESTYDTKITEIEGSPWTLHNWYGQVLGADDYPNRLDIGLDPSLQQYQNIKNLVIKTVESLSASTDDNVISTVTGSANMFPGVTPNQWDMFTGKMRDGRIGLFTIVELPERQTYLAYSSYRITYELVSYLTTDLQAELDRKTVNVLYFNPENPTCPGTNVTELVDRAEAVKLLHRFVDMYYDYFYDLRTRTFIMFKEGETSKYYDDAVVKFLNALIPTEILGKRPRATGYAIPSTEWRSVTKTIFDVMMDGEVTLWNNIESEFRYVASGEYYSPFIMNSISLTDIATVIEPVNHPSLHRKEQESEGFYVFSENFYVSSDSGSNETLNTKFESLVKDHLHRNFTDLTTAAGLVEGEIEQASREQLFHIIPVCIWLLLNYLD